MVGLNNSTYSLSASSVLPTWTSEMTTWVAAASKGVGRTRKNETAKNNGAMIVGRRPVI